MATYRKSKKAKSNGMLWTITLLLVFVLVVGAVCLKMVLNQTEKPEGSNHIAPQTDAVKLSVLENTGWVNDSNNHTIRQCSSSTEKEHYYIRREAYRANRIFRVDYATMEEGPICQNPEGTSQDGTDSSSGNAFEMNNLVVVDGQLYAIQRGSSAQHGPQIAQLDEKGEIEKILVEFPQSNEIEIGWRSENYGFFTDGQFLYFGLSEEDSSGALKSAKIVAVSLEDGATRVIYTGKDETSITILGAQDRSLVCFCITVNGPSDAIYQYAVIDADTGAKQTLPYTAEEAALQVSANGHYSVRMDNVKPYLYGTKLTSMEPFEIDLQPAMAELNRPAAANQYVFMLPFHDRHGVVVLDGDPALFVDFETGAVEPFELVREDGGMLSCADASPYGWLVDIGTSTFEKEIHDWVLMDPEDYLRSQKKWITTDQ